MTGGAASPTASPLRVAVLGAGPAGLATAWGLTKRLPGGANPNVDVTVYERSWRAGGKCASTRLAPGHRIVQNGTHYLFGVYFNAFQMLDEAHAEIQDSRFGGMGDFVPRNLIALKHYYDSTWHNWKFELPSRGQQVSGFQSPEQYLPDALRALKQRLIDDGILPKEPALTLLLDALIQAAVSFASNPNNAGVIATILNLVQSTRVVVHAMLGPSKDIRIVQGRILVDFLLTIVSGVLKDGALAGNIQAIDAKDFAAWLAYHGAQPETCTSPLVTAWYDSVAAYEQGDPTRPAFSAAAVLQTILPALVAYRGSFAFQMKAEVGESFIAPIYYALHKRGVKFRFLHELREVVPDSSGTKIERLVFDVPSLPNQPVGSAEKALETYDPLTEFTLPNGTKRCYWPPEPNKPFTFAGRIGFDRPLSLRPCGPPRDRVERNLGTHFDRVVFAIPHVLAPAVAPRVLSQKAAWRDQVDHVLGVETKSVRLWLQTRFDDIKWDGAVPASRPVLSAYRPLFSTWEDGGQQLELQDWPTPAPRSIATVFGPLACSKHPPQSQFREWLNALVQQWSARSQALTFLKNHAAALWPGLVDASGILRWSELVPVEKPPERFQEQWVVANSAASDRYTQALPGTFAYRLRSGATGYTNLSVAGEWTRFWPGTANLELTVISGLRAAYDILGVATPIPSEKGFFPG